MECLEWSTVGCLSRHLSRKESTALPSTRATGLALTKAPRRRRRAQLAGGGLLRRAWLCLVSECFGNGVLREWRVLRRPLRQMNCRSTSDFRRVYQHQICFCFRLFGIILDRVVRSSLIYLLPGRVGAGQIHRAGAAGGDPCGGSGWGMSLDASRGRRLPGKSWSFARTGRDRAPHATRRRGAGWFGVGSGCCALVTRRNLFIDLFI